MELTYTTTDTGYTILNHGVPWIVQDGYIPYPGETMEESAQNHINQIVADKQKEDESVDKIEALEAELTQTQLALAEIASLLGGAV
jgi:hypothetical protein